MIFASQLLLSKIEKRMGQGLNCELGEASNAEFTRRQLCSIQSQLIAEADGAYTSNPLTAIDIPNSSLTDDGARVAGSLLQHANSVTSLDVSYNGMTPNGVEALFLGNGDGQGLCGSLGAPKKLRVLRLSGNDVGLQGTKALCQFLRIDPVEGREEPENEGERLQNESSAEYETAQEAAAAHVVHLEELYLYNCNLDDHCFLELANSLLVNPTLNTLHLDMNPKITGKSVIILRQLLETNKGLCRVSLGNVVEQPEDLVRLPPGIKKEVRETVEMGLKQNSETLERRKRVAAVKEVKAQRRKEREEREANERAQRDRAELERKEAEMAALEELRFQEEAEVRRLQAVMAEKLQARGERAEKLSAEKQASVERALENAEKWKERMTGHGTLQKEWRSGFTTLKTDPGDITGEPKVVGEAPRLLRACWCDPQDATAPYARTLHYHCKFEMSKQKKGPDMRDDTGDGPVRYEGCKGLGHQCATENFRGTKPLPDRSAAHFFSSPHPTTAASLQ